VNTFKDLGCSLYCEGEKTDAEMCNCLKVAGLINANTEQSIIEKQSRMKMHNVLSSLTSLYKNERRNKKKITAQNRWASELCSPSNILTSRKHSISEFSDFFPVISF
jgi:hypothetical protein